MGLTGQLKHSRPVCLGGITVTGLSFEDATELVDALNHQDLEIECEARRLVLAAKPLDPALCSAPRPTRSAIALIGLALAAALPAAGCMGTTAALREGRSAQTTEQVQQPQVDATRWMRWTPLAGLRPLFRLAGAQLPHPANTSNAITLRFDETPAEHPDQRSATRA